MAKEKLNLKDLRAKIDALDEKIVKLLNTRAQCSEAIGKSKKKTNSGIYSPAREKSVFEHIKRINKGPLPDDALEAIYREVMSGSLLLEDFPPVAFFGTVGSFTYMAAYKKFGAQAEYAPCQSIFEVFQKVEQGDCAYGVVPIENSTEGAVTHTFDLLVDSDLKICAQLMMKISHCLMAHPSVKDLQDIRKVYTHPQVFGQCRNWLLRHMPQVSQIQVMSTTDAAQKVQKEQGTAAIAAQAVAAMYQLHILKSNIQDVTHNTTRFLVIGKQAVGPTSCDRTSIVFSIKDKVGALHDMLQPFHKNRINLTKIESRPSKKKAWDYYFFVDFEGHISQPHVKNALECLEGMCKYLRILGSYPV